MTGIYIIEDDISVIEMLEDMIEDMELGEILGTTEDGPADIEEILRISPDIILIDFLMPGKDGAALAKELKERGCRAKFIMLSQVSSKDMVAKAYSSGIDFFISKPLNVIEVQSVISQVEKQQKNERTIEHLRGMLLGSMDDSESFGKNASVQSEKKRSDSKKQKSGEEDEFVKAVSYILSRLGIAGEKGSADIIGVCRYLHEEKRSLSRESISQICASLSEAPKSMEQRMRRAVMAALGNIAHLGIEDFGNEIYVEYSSSLFPFTEVRAEMDFIRGKRRDGGRTTTKRFVENLMVEAERRISR